MFVYIAAPYTSSLENEVSKRAQEDQRYAAIERYMVDLFSKDPGPVVPLSPVIHCRDLALRHQIPTTYNFWQTYCEETLWLISLDIRSEVHVLMLPGWEESTGVKQEIKRAEELGVFVKYISV